LRATIPHPLLDGAVDDVSNPALSNRFKPKPVKLLAFRLPLKRLPSPFSTISLDFFFW